MEERERYQAEKQQRREREEREREEARGVNTPQSQTKETVAIKTLNFLKHFNLKKLGNF